MSTSMTTRLIPAVALLGLLAGPPVMAQTGGGAASSSSAAGTAGASSDNRPSGGGAPIGHRQPRLSDVPSEKNLGDPNDPLSKENAALDRKIKSICRGC